MDYVTYIAASVSSCCTNRCAAPPSSKKDPHSVPLLLAAIFTVPRFRALGPKPAADTTMTTNAASFNMTSVDLLLSILDHNTDRTMTGSVEN